MKKTSFFKRLSLYREYKRVVRNNSSELEAKFGLRVDRANRLYTVINVPPDTIGDSYNLKKSDVDKIAEGYIRDYSVEVSKFLDSKNLKEMYDFYDIKKVEKYSYLVVFGPHKDKVINSEVYTKNLYYRILPASIISVLIFLLILFI